MENNSIPVTGFLRLSTILQIIPVSKSTWWAGIKTGRFPQSVKLGERITAWRVEDINNLINSQNNISSNKEVGTYAN